MWCHCIITPMTQAAILLGSIWPSWVLASPLILAFATHATKASASHLALLMLPLETLLIAKMAADGNGDGDGDDDDGDGVMMVVIAMVLVLMTMAMVMVLR